jgi:hypothetical protein
MAIFFGPLILAFVNGFLLLPGWLVPHPGFLSLAFACDVEQPQGAMRMPTRSKMSQLQAK